MSVCVYQTGTTTGYSFTWLGVQEWSQDLRPRASSGDCCHLTWLRFGSPSKSFPAIAMFQWLQVGSPPENIVANVWYCWLHVGSGTKCKSGRPCYIISFTDNGIAKRSSKDNYTGLKLLTRMIFIHLYRYGGVCGYMSLVKIVVCLWLC